MDGGSEEREEVIDMTSSIPHMHVYSTYVKRSMLRVSVSYRCSLSGKPLRNSCFPYRAGEVMTLIKAETDGYVPTVRNV